MAQEHGLSTMLIRSRRWKGSRIVWIKGKIGIVKYAWVSVYAPVNKAAVTLGKIRQDSWQMPGFSPTVPGNARIFGRLSVSFSSWRLPGILAFVRIY